MKLPLLSSIASIAVLAALPILTQAQDCLNSKTFEMFYSNRKRSCQNIRMDRTRQQSMCRDFAEVRENCPQTCGRCCMDDSSWEFALLDETMVKCSWLTNNEARKSEYCKTWRSGSMVRDACPFSCSFCQPGLLEKTPTIAPVPATSPPTKNPTKGDTPSPTKAPTKVPTSTPTKPPTTPPTMSSNKPTIVCENNDDYFILSNPTATCLWIGENENRRRDACKNAETVRNCPQICGVCCEDDTSYNIVTNGPGTKKRCGWIELQDNRKERYCETVNQGRLVKAACPIACGFCFKPVD